MDNMVEVGKVEGTRIYIQEPFDEWKPIKDKIQRIIDTKKIKEGDGWIMSVAFNSDLYVEMRVKSLSCRNQK